MKKYTLFILGLSVFLYVNSIIPAISSGVYIVDSDPESGAENVTVDTWIIIRFNQSIVADDVEVEIRPNLDPYGFRTEWSNDNKELIIKPNDYLLYSSNYTIIIRGANDVDGNPLDGPTSLYFNTESESETIMESNSEIPRFLVQLIFFLIFGFIITLLLVFWLFRKRV